MDDRPYSNRRSALTQRGFTLIELIIVLAIVAILVVIGVPSMNEMIVNQKVRGTANDLLMDLSYARSEAIKRNANVELVRAGADWTGGWSVRIVTGGAVIRVQPAIKGVSSCGATVANVTFGPDGRSSLTTPPSPSFDFAPISSPPCTVTIPPSPVSWRCVSIGPSGRAAVRTDRNKDGNCTNG